MKVVIPAPWLGFIIGTRAALAFGVGLLLADRIPRDRRRTLGLALVAFGAVSTIPAARAVFGHGVRDPEAHAALTPAM